MSSWGSISRSANKKLKGIEEQKLNYENENIKLKAQIQAGEGVEEDRQELMQTNKTLKS